MSGDPISVEYLNDERIKLWAKLIELEQAIEKRTPEHEVESRSASKKAAEYKNRAEKSFEFAQAACNSAQAIASKLEDITSQNTSILQDIKGWQTSIKEAEGSTKEHIENIENAAQKARETISSIDETTEAIEEEKKRLLEIEKTTQQQQDLQKKTELLHKNALTLFKEIDECHTQIFGYTEIDDNTGEETEVEGTKDKLEKAYKELTSKVEQSEKTIESLSEEAAAKATFVEKKWEGQHAALKKKIENLLPDALTAGLSHAYSDKKNAEVDECKRINKTFNAAISGLFLISLIPFSVSIYSLIEKTPLPETIERLPRLVMAIIPLYIPVTWLAYSANKKLNLSKRLIEEYTHKEVLSKTYEGLARQISEIGDDDTSHELKTKLLYNILDVSSENPGKLISDYNKADHPLMDALDKSVKLANAVDKLSKIPGFAKVAISMKEKADKLVIDEGAKASAGLEMNKPN